MPQWIKAFATKSDNLNLVWNLSDKGKELIHESCLLIYICKFT